MQIIDDLVRSIQLIAIVIVLILLLIGAIGFYFFKVRKKNGIEKEVDCANFKREDSVSYVMFDDISEKMVITDGGKRFIAAVKCQGVNYNDAETEEKLQIIRGYISFFNVVDKNPIQFRQSARDINLDNMIRSYKLQLNTLQEQQYEYSLEYEDLKKMSESIEDISEEDYDIYYQKLKELQRMISSLGYQCNQLNAQIQYMLNISGDNAEASREEMYVFDWTYNPLDFSSQNLSKEEIYQRAVSQLDIKAQSYIQALRSCGVYAKRMVGVEQMEEIRRYTHPISAAKDCVEDIVQMAFDNIVVTSNSLEKLEIKLNSEILNEVIDGLDGEGGV